MPASIHFQTMQGGTSTAMGLLSHYPASLFIRSVVIFATLFLSQQLETPFALAIEMQASSSSSDSVPTPSPIVLQPERPRTKKLSWELAGIKQMVQEMRQDILGESTGAGEVSTEENRCDSTLFEPNDLEWPVEKETTGEKAKTEERNNIFQLYNLCNDTETGIEKCKLATNTLTFVNNKFGNYQGLNTLREYRQKLKEDLIQLLGERGSSETEEIEEVRYSINLVNLLTAIEYRHLGDLTQAKRAITVDC